MKKQSDSLMNDTPYKELDENIVWDQKQKQQVGNRLITSMHKQDRKTKLLRVVKFSSSVVAVLLLLFIGYQFVLHENLLNIKENQAVDPVDQHEPQLPAGPETDPKLEEIYEVQYYGQYGESSDYQTIALTDSNAMYFIPVSIPNIDEAARQILHFSANEQIREQLVNEYDLAPTLFNQPLQHSELIDKHLHLYFAEDDLNNIRGSTGTAMGYYNFASFAKSFNENVERYTVYGDGEPFYHYGEELVLDNLAVNRTAAFFPIRTAGGIFLREDFYPYTSIDEIFDLFLSRHERPDLPDLENPVIDLSMVTLESIKQEGNEIEIELRGEVLQSESNAYIQPESLKLLIAQGLGANVRDNQQFFDQRVEEASIRLNGETIFDGSLSTIRINVLDDLTLDADVFTQETATTPIELELDKLKVSIQLGQTQVQVKKTFGEHVTELTSALDNLTEWRYDLGVNKSYYSFEHEDSVNFDGLIKGDLFAQLFITWTDEQRVQSFTIYYFHQQDEMVYEYRVFPDGDIRETPIT